jgi:hypothetical protein
LLLPGQQGRAIEREISTRAHELIAAPVAEAATLQHGREP